MKFDVWENASASEVIGEKALLPPARQILTSFLLFLFLRVSARTFGCS